MLRCFHPTSTFGTLSIRYGDCILIGVMGSIVFFLIPRGIAKITYWIIDGFREDKNR